MKEKEFLIWETKVLVVAVEMCDYIKMEFNESYSNEQRAYFALEGLPRLPLITGEVDDGGGAGRSHAEHCHDPSGIASRPTQYEW